MAPPISTHRATAETIGRLDDEKEETNPLHTLVATALAARPAMGLPPSTFSDDPSDTSPLVFVTGRDLHRKQLAAKVAAAATGGGVLALPLPSPSTQSPEEDDDFADLPELGEEDLPCNSPAAWSVQFTEVKKNLFYRGKKEIDIEKREGISPYSDLSDFAEKLLKPYLQPDADPIARAGALILEKSSKHHKTAYDTQYQHLKEMIADTTKDLEQMNSTKLHDRSKQLDRLCRKMKKDLHRLRKRSDEVAHFFLHPDFLDQITTTGPILIPDYFDEEFNAAHPHYIRINRDEPWEERIPKIWLFYQDYAKVLEQHKYYTAKFLAGIQKLSNFFRLGSDLYAKQNTFA